MIPKKTIVVAMSGGVDSSTAAAILKAEGHKVIGVTLQLYDYGNAVGKKGACCAGQDIYDAQMAAEKLGIPHYVLNYESIFKQQVIDDFADSYLRGETPIPCVRCNQKVKFKDLFKVAKDLGADALATGHYVQRFEVNGVAELHKGADESKDQSYFLFTTTQEQLDFLHFPIGSFNKNYTRNIAADYGLAVSDKPDSQDICFVPEGNYSKVIAKLRPEAYQPGNVVLSSGERIGFHEGIVNYTIGQRRGINIAYHEPLYVIKIDPSKNEVTVGPRWELGASQLSLKEMNWLVAIDTLSQDKKFTVKLRSAHSGCKATIDIKPNGKVAIHLAEDYFGITPGQACVIYDKTKVIGGGWIVHE